MPFGVPNHLDRPWYHWLCPDWWNDSPYMLEICDLLSRLEGMEEIQKGNQGSQMGRSKAATSRIEFIIGEFLTSIGNATKMNLVFRE